MAGRKIALAGLLALSPMLASGQDSQLDSTLKLDAVVVTGTRTEKRLSEAPVYIFRTADGSAYFKVEFTQYQDENKVTGHVRFNYAKLSD